MQIEAVPGDITEQVVDVIVNAANPSLYGGGGVDGAIHQAAGPALLQACERVRDTRYPSGLPVGEAVATSAGRLHARWVVHTVGPNRHAGQTDPALLSSCFRTSLLVSQSLGAETVAVPAVGAGVYGWDGAEVARIAVTTAREVDDAGMVPGITTVRFVLFSPHLLAKFDAVIGGRP